MEPSIGWFKRETMSDDERRHALAHELGLPFVQLDRDSISLEAMVLVPESVAREHNIVAYSLAEGSLQVALLDVADLNELEFLRSRYRLLPRLTSRESMTRGLLHYQRHLAATYGAALGQTQSPQLLDTLLRHALHSCATDIHLQNTQEGLLVRYRINSSLKNAMTLPPAAGKNVITKLRSLSGVPAGSLPREGALRVDLGNGEDLSVRVSSVPIINGEKLVLHLAREKARRGHTLESLGLHGEALEAVHKTLLKRRSLVAVSGAHGSGPSATLRTGTSTLLYTLLDLLNVPEISIATVENRVEYHLPRVAQTDIEAAGVTKAAALRAALKQDCDVVMISSVEDTEVAQVAAAAAARGVLVLAGIEDAEIFPAPDLFIQTALVRRLGGKQIADKHKLTRAQADGLEEFADFANVLSALKEEGKVGKDTQWKEIQFGRPTPNSEHPNGYLPAGKAGSGFVGIQEVVREGRLAGLNLIEDAIFKAAIGLTSIEEVKKLLV